MSTLRDQIQAALQAGLKSLVPDVAGRVFVEIDRAYTQGDYPCLNVQLGAMNASYEGGEFAGPGARLTACEYVLSVDVVDDETYAESRVRTKAIASAVRKALAQVATVLPFATDLKFGGEMPVFFATDQGRGGGYTLTYSATFTVCESDPDTALTPNDPF